MKYPLIIKEIHSNQWAIEKSALQGIVSAVQGELTSDDYELFHKLSEEQRLNCLSQFEPGPEGTRYTRISGSIGALMIEGPIVPRSDWLTEMSGLVSIERLTSEFKALEEDEEIKTILIIFDTPGGSVFGVSDFANIVSESKKVTIGFVFGMAASAGYWIASATDKIIAADTSIVGSIGTVITTQADTDGLIKIISSQSPKKNMDPGTEEGRKELQTIVDDISTVFIGAVAKYRDVNANTVLTKYGQGGIFVAAAAMEHGMIDGIMTFADLITALKNGVDIKESSYIDLTGGESSANTGSNKKEISQMEKTYTEKELKTAEEKAFENGVSSVQKKLDALQAKNDDFQARIAAAAPYIGNDAYPKKISEFAMQTIEGKFDVSALLGAIAAVDSIQEGNKQDEAEKETKAAGATPPQNGGSNLSGDGMVRTVDDIAEISAFADKHAFSA